MIDWPRTLAPVRQRNTEVLPLLLWKTSSQGVLVFRVLIFFLRWRLGFHWVLDRVRCCSCRRLLPSDIASVFLLLLLTVPLTVPLLLLLLLLLLMVVVVMWWWWACCYLSVHTYMHQHSVFRCLSVHTCATVSSVMSQLFQVTTITIVCSTRFCTSASLLWLWIANTLHIRPRNKYRRVCTCVCMKRTQEHPTTSAAVPG